MFRKNKAHNYSGCLSLVKNANSSFTFRDSLFEGNSAPYAAALFYDISGYLMLENCTFRHNEATETDGGAVYFAQQRQLSVYDGHVIVKNCTFFNNSAARHAGALNFIGSFQNANLTIRDSQFTANIAKKYGGAVAIDRSQLPIIEDSIFYNNSALQGAAAFVWVYGHTFLYELSDDKVLDTGDIESVTMLFQI